MTAPSNSALIALLAHDGGPDDIVGFTVLAAPPPTPQETP